MTADRVRPIEIHGYAIVSDDDMIAAADGLTPLSCAMRRIGNITSARKRAQTSSYSPGAAMNSSPTSEATAAS